MNKYYARTFLGLFQGGIKWIFTSLQFIPALVLAFSLMAINPSLTAPAHFKIATTMNGLASSHILWLRNGIGCINFASLNATNMESAASNHLSFNSKSLLLSFQRQSIQVTPRQYFSNESAFRPMTAQQEIQLD